MKWCNRSIIFMACILVTVRMGVEAESVSGSLFGYGLTNAMVEGEKKQVVTIKILKSDGTYSFVAYVIDGSPYCDYIFNILANSDVWQKNRLDITYDNSKSLFKDINNNEYKEIQSFFLH